MDKDASILLFENEVEKNKLEKWINNIKLVSKTKLDSIYEVDIYWDIKRFLDDMNRRGETFGTIIYRIEHIEKNTYRVIQRNNNSF